MFLHVVSKARYAMSLPMSWTSISLRESIFWTSFRSSLKVAKASRWWIGQYSKGMSVLKFLTGWSRSIIMDSMRKLPEPQKGSHKYNFPVF